MIKHYDVLQKIKKDSFLTRFYEKHANLIIYKKRFEDIMNAFSVAFRLSGDFVLKKERKSAGIKILPDVTNIQGLIERDEETHADQIRSIGTKTLSYSAYNNLSYVIEPQKKEEIVDHWTLKHKKSKSFFSIEEDLYYFTLKNDLIHVEVHNSRKVSEDSELNKYIVEKIEGTYSSRCTMEVNNLDDLEEVLNRILILVG